jgi:hypothetical protein
MRDGRLTIRTLVFRIVDEAVHRGRFDSARALERASNEWMAV